MDMDIEKLKQKLETNIVLIKFESLKSRRVYDREYTLCEKYMSIPKHIKKQNGDKLICYDVEFQKWEDLQVDTILEFKVVE
jgi:hypothetical protein|tara:strand:- start:442 stop:684 length:243 start_codon:yes stop_codon:yes gene_type:complete